MKRMVLIVLNMVLVHGCTSAPQLAATGATAAEEPISRPYPYSPAGW